MVKNAGDPRFIPGLGRFPGEGNGYPRQYSCIAMREIVFLPGESQGQESLVGCRLWGRTESDMTEAT